MLYGIIAYLVISIIFLFLMSYKEKFKFYLCLKVLICLIILVLFNLILFIFFKEITMFAHLIFYIVGGTSLLFLNKKKYYSITALAILLLEIFAFNPLAYKDKEYQTSTINLNDITLLQNVELINEEYLTIKNDSRIKFNYLSFI
ncbi:MAG: hypothetical protein LBM99_05590 [Bacillales bacterium]|jgi:cellulose synthase/poly-beta-1,6-N-acetylglucosamine synthase-like glycosyltransferase|nr:hypothetical protein [Bacillales bacterium]